MVRVSEVLPPEAPDEEIVDRAIGLGRAILSYDLDFAKIIVQSGLQEPSLVSLRLREDRVDEVNNVLGEVLPVLEALEGIGIIAAVRPHRYRIHRL